MPAQITVRGARLHNLKNVTLTIPKNRLVVLTGLSGSGKSTFGFDILLKEGQRQYLESLGILPYGMASPPVDSISGLSPAVSVEQHLANRSPRSTVGTATGVYTYLRVLFARLGLQRCLACGVVIQPQIRTALEDLTSDSDIDGEPSAPEEFSVCPNCGTAVVKLTMAHFSFNKPAGACPTCSGLGSVQQADLRRLVDERRSLTDGAVAGWNDALIQYHIANLRAAANHYGFTFDVSRPVKDFTPIQRDLLFYGVESPRFRRHFPDIEPPATVRKGRFEGAATNLLRRYAEHVTERVREAGNRDPLEDMLISQACPDCGGDRLRPESLAVTVAGQNILAISRLPVSDVAVWLGGLSEVFSPIEQSLAEPILAAMQERIGNLIEAGAGYLSLSRTSPTLSAGEAQRLRLASLLGSGLSGVLYVLDEPTIGLHQRDTQRLIVLLRRLRDLDNTVLVIEHDLETIAAADHVIDFGPGGGRHGGQVIAVGTPVEVANYPGSATGDYLSGRAAISVPAQRRGPGERILTLHGARLHNLQNITVRLPLGSLVAVTGVSGSGKTSLVFDILAHAVRMRLEGRMDASEGYDSVEGCESLDNVITIDQDPVGRVPRSNAATYTDVYTPIRQAFAATPEAKRGGLSARSFSFNVSGGRCERCQGMGVLPVQMQLLPEMTVVCPTCRGRRFMPETLSVRYRGYDIAQVLDLTVEEALTLFADIPAASSRLKVLVDAGLGYLQLGQPATTLSGGEAQRVKLAKELGRRVTGRTLYLLDEPTTGLHLADTAHLLSVLQRLVDGGSSVVVVEHNLELIKTVDWIIDLGPEGGAGGGRVVAEGTPEQVAQVKESYTGQYLKALLSPVRKG